MSEKKSSGSIEPDLVRELAAILRDTGLTEIEVEHGEMKLKLVKAAPQVITTAAPAMAVPSAAFAAPAAPAAPTPASEAKPDLRSHPGAVLSPMVGTAYLSPEPGAAMFVKVGDQVAEGQTVLIVEAMKTFNPIPAPRAGRVAQILVSDAQPVEYGEPLLVLE